MGLIDILNKVPLKTCSKLVEKTGVSKYDYAQVCNFSAVIPAAWCFFEGYNGGHTMPMIAGGIMAFFNILYTTSNPKRKSAQDPNFVEKIVEEVHKKNPEFNDGDLRKRIENNLVKADYIEDKLKLSALFQTGIGIGLGMLAGLGVSSAYTAGEPFNSETIITGTLGLSCLFTGVSHYFRACKPKDNR